MLIGANLLGQDEGEIAAHGYHAGMTPKQRVKVQNDWRRGELQVVVATIAFGMGAALLSHLLALCFHSRHLCTVTFSSFIDLGTCTLQKLLGCVHMALRPIQKHVSTEIASLVQALISQTCALWSTTVCQSPSKYVITSPCDLHTNTDSRQQFCRSVLALLWLVGSAMHNS